MRLTLNAAISETRQLFHKLMASDGWGGFSGQALEEGGAATELRIMIQVASKRGLHHILEFPEFDAPMPGCDAGVVHHDGVAKIAQDDARV
jgi:hypothetical protein